MKQCFFNIQKYTYSPVDLFAIRGRQKRGKKFFLITLTTSWKCSIMHTNTVYISLGQIHVTKNAPFLLS